MMDGKYHVLYEVTPKPEGISRAEIPPGFGAADGVIIHSVIGVPGGPGGLSVMTMGKDGVSGERYTAEEEFKIWTIWAHDLAHRLPPGGRQQLCAFVDDALRAALRARDEAEAAERDLTNKVAEEVMQELAAADPEIAEALRKPE